MSKRTIDRQALAARILGLEGLTNEEKSDLLELINTRKKYGLVWEDKPERVEEEMRSKIPVFKEVKERRILNDTETEKYPNHILIEGDNLQALTTLAYTHEGKIDVIYIDPPYNTGNKFIYSDKFKSEGLEDNYFHSKWISFIYRRLAIAKRLLSENGVLFISIDDHELYNLNIICSEIFGNDNFIAAFPRLATKSGKTPISYMISHDYVMCFTKCRKDLFIGRSFEDNSYKYEDEFVKERGKYNLKQPLDCNSISYSSSLDYPITHDGKTYYPGSDKGKFEERKSGKHLLKDYAWRWSKELYEFGLKNGWIVFQNNRIYTKGYLNAIIEKNENGQYEIRKKEKTRKLSTIDFIDNSYSNDIAKKELENFKLSRKFDYPKPTNLLKELIFSYYSNNATILDFFAGSGTTLHATMQLNAEDGGHRQCILVTNNENKICEEVTYERNKRVIEGYTTPKGEQVEGLHGNNLRYYTTELMERENSQQNRVALMKASADLLCIKEDIYTEQDELNSIKFNKNYVRFFKDGDHSMLLIFDPCAIGPVVEQLADMTFVQPAKVYVYSADEYPYTDDFEDVAEKVELVALPTALRKALQNILPEPGKEQKIEDEVLTETEKED